MYGGSPLNIGLEIGAMEPSGRIATGIRLMSTGAVAFDMAPRATPQRNWGEEEVPGVCCNERTSQGFCRVPVVHRGGA